MTAIDDLVQKVVYPNGASGLPILVVMHGFNQSYNSFTSADLERLASYGFVVCVPAMRGRWYAEAYNAYADGSRREIQDVIDGVIALRADSVLGTKCSATKAAIVGYSGGGGNALACACKFPDFFNVVVAHCAMSDYGRDGTDGWWANNGAGEYTAGIEAMFGGTPAGVPNNYYAADATVAITNYTGGFLYLYHDKQDTKVPWVHANRIKTAMDGAGLVNYSATFSDIGDGTRFLHGYPSDAPGDITVEPTWSAKIGTQAVWTIPASGNVAVIGYIVTKRFSIWLRANGTALYGLDAAATVAYDTATDEYTITPLTGAMDATVTQGAKTGSAANFAVPTLITVA